MGDLPQSILSDVVAGLIGTGIVSLTVLFWSKVGPERCRGWVRAMAWPMATFMFFALTASVAILRNATGPLAAGLALAVGSASLVLAVFRFGPARVRQAGRAVRGKAWPLLAGVFCLTSLYLLLFDIGAVSRPARVVVAIDLAPEELIRFREVLDDLEPELGCEIELQWVPQDRQLDRLESMVRAGDVRWDVVAFDNAMAGAVAESGLVEDLGRWRDGPVEGAGPLVPALHRLTAAGGDGRARLMPLRANLKVGFYRKAAFADRAPPASLSELAAWCVEGGGGRLVIQGHPDRGAATTLHEALGMDPRRLGSRPLADAVAHLRRLRPALHPESVRADYGLVNELLIDDQVDLACNWSYAYRKVIEEAGRADVGVYAGWQRARVLGGEVLAIPRGAANPECAARLIDLLLSARAQRSLAERLCWIPARLDAHDALPRDLALAVRPALAGAFVRPGTSRWPDNARTLARAYEVVMGLDDPDLDELLALLRGDAGSGPRGRVAGDISGLP